MDRDSSHYNSEAIHLAKKVHVTSFTCIYPVAACYIHVHMKCKHSTPQYLNCLRYIGMMPPNLLSKDTLVELLQNSHLHVVIVSLKDGAT